MSLGFGNDVDPQQILNASRRCELLVRAYNCREYVRREDDSLPERYFKEPIQSGIYKGAIFDKKEFEKMKDEYYELRGWSKETGVPTRATLEKYGLKYVADDLEKRGVLDTAPKKTVKSEKEVKESIKA